MTTARQLMDLLDRVQRLRELADAPPEEILKTVPEDQFRLMVYSTATLFKALKVEAQRRGIWDDLKTQKLQKPTT